jgi:uncharacterized membrane protein
MDGLQMEVWLQTLFGYVIMIVEMCSVLVITVGASRTIIGFIKAFVLHYRPADLHELRIMLGKSMVMGLEFQVAADILKTSRAPNWNAVLLLAAIIALRTLLNFLLERELELLDDDHPFVQSRSGEDGE